MPPSTICRVTLMVAYSSKPMGDFFLSLLSKTIVTLALVTPAWPRLYMRSYRRHACQNRNAIWRQAHERGSGIELTCKFCARTVDMFVIPKTKQMESRMLDLPLPLRPVMELKLSSL